MLVRVYEFWIKVRKEAEERFRRGKNKRRGKAWYLKIIINFSIFVVVGGVYVNLRLCYGSS
jgi:hypothetical protein